MNCTSILTKISVVLATIGPACGQLRTSAKPPVPREFPREISPTKIILVGDSTTAVIGGWGPSFCAAHVTSFAACINLARGGRSSRTYMQERSWDVALNEARVPGYAKVYILLQFGHNDQPGNSRSTELEQEFPGYLRRYVADARAAGAIPILLTPLVRRTFRNGRVINDLLPWSDAVRKISVETGTTMIDLNALSLAAVEKLGPDASQKLAQLPRGSTPAAGAANLVRTEIGSAPTAIAKLSFDATHLGEKGADFFAAIIAGELAAKITELRPLLILNRREDRRPLDSDGL